MAVSGSGGAGPVYLVRHGETVFNEEGRYQGQLDSPLTERGVSQARAVAAMLAARLGTTPVRILSSPMGRALATARIVESAIAGPVAVEIDDRLSEVRMGAWDGLTRAEIKAKWPEARRGRPGRSWIFHGPEGEALDAFAARIRSALDGLPTKDGEALILVSHAMTGRIIRALHAGTSFSEALALDAPQDAAFELAGEGRVTLLPTPDYTRRMAALR